MAKKVEKFFIGKKTLVLIDKPVYEVTYGVSSNCVSLGTTYFDLLELFEIESKERIFGGYRDD